MAHGRLCTQAASPKGLGTVTDPLAQTPRDAPGDSQCSVSSAGKGKKSGVAVVFAVGILDAGAGQLAGAAFVVDARIEEHYKETVRQICQTIRVADQFAEKKQGLLKRPGVSRAEGRPARLFFDPPRAGLSGVAVLDLRSDRS